MYATGDLLPPDLIPAYYLYEETSRKLYHLKPSREEIFLDLAVLRPGTYELRAYFKPGTKGSKYGTTLTIYDYNNPYDIILSFGVLENTLVYLGSIEMVVEKQINNYDSYSPSFTYHYEQVVDEEVLNFFRTKHPEVYNRYSDKIIRIYK